MARRKELTEEQQKEIKLLKANYEMYENTKKEVAIRGDKKTMDRINIAQQDINDQINLLMSGKNIDSMKIEGTKDDYVEPVTINKEETQPKIPTKERPSVYDILERNRKEEKEKKTQINPHTETNKIVETSQSIKYGSEIVNPKDTTFNDVDVTAQYDIISLPSNGECYKDKTSRIPVAYLTAYDENIITSPNLYRDGLVIDYLLKNKIVNRNVKIDELITGDVDAIVLFLRATSYGVEFPIIVSDPETGEQIETTVDLSTLKNKEFKLKGDENGHFSFTLPKSNVGVKFKYLTRREENDLALLARIETRGSVATDLRDVHRVLDAILRNDDVLDSREKGVMLDANRRIDEWAKRIEEKHDEQFNHVITNRMEMQITAVNGSYDREYIRKFLHNMTASDSLALRRYINENEPGINFEIEVKRPESLGGGSFKTFLEWNDNVFFNIA